ncbi:hypothetical protein B566_EDAN013563 [Ephemera danica]|nr:hypothetical protein B566_EDAN013563 [Ephemera danica]
MEDFLGLLYSCLLYSTVFGFFLLFLLCIILVKFSSPYPDIHRSEKEKFFYDPLDDRRMKLPYLDKKPSVKLSVVVPAYDEEERLPAMLDECLSYLSERQELNPTFSYEVLVVSDGSKDGTVRLAHEYARRWGTNTLRVLDLQPNRGKGGAIRLGVQNTRGAVILFADADGATKFADLEKLEDSLKDLVHGDYIKEEQVVVEKQAIVCGSRAHLEQEAIASRSYVRTFLMHGFHFLVWLLAVRGVRDTQCGFKLLTRATAFQCFSCLHIERWAFDVELLYVAQQLKVPLAEVAVRWTEIDGSKIVPVWSWLQMGRDIFLIWLRYAIGAWKLKTKEE